MKAVFLAFLLGVAGGAQTADLRGIVVDTLGGPIPDATVRLEQSGHSVGEARTGTDGKFTFPLERSALTQVVVDAAGFSQATLNVAPDSQDVRITLAPAPFFEAINVTASRTDSPRVDSTQTVTVFSASDLLASGAVTIDDALKVVPGFTLFRRTSSRTSNPTAQGVSLRGLGGTGASRSLVLADGVPLNDAFGGWVYWAKVPQAAIDRVEVLRGSGSDLYGADAVGGVVQILTVRPSRPSGRVLAEGGGLGTGRVSLFGGGRTSRWSYSGSGEWFSTDGYITVAEEQDPGIAPRGPIDTEAGSTHRSALGSLGYHDGGWRFEGSANFFTEDRQNGTPATINATASRVFSAEAAGDLGGGAFSARIAGGSQGYDQTFSAVSADRTSEDLNRLQHVPTRTVGAGGQWVRPFGRHTVLLGVEGRFIRGETQETQLLRGRVIGQTVNGGDQAVGSAFVQDSFAVTDRLTVVAGAHGDGWRTESQNTEYNKTLGAFNPRVSFAYRVATGVSVRAAAYGGFRAPTLNELYRGFRAGNTQTNPNEALRPERLRGVDGGLLAARGALSARITGFWDALHDTITNITLSTTPLLITKVRANADRVRSAGLEIEADWRVVRPLALTFGVGIVDARFKGDTSLRDNRVPQVAEYNAAAGLRFAVPEWTASAQLRITGLQFEDDLNAFALRRATVVDVMGGRTFARRMQLFVAIENLFNTESDVGRTPVLTLGLPRVARAGVQLSLP